MADKTSIGNAALKNVKVSKRVSNIETDDTKESNAILDIYDDKLDELEEIHTWNFASTRVKMSRDSATPAFGYRYQYTVPPDYIRKVGVWDNAAMAGQLDYVIESDSATGALVLRTDAPNVYLLYVRRVVDPNLMPPTFRAAFACLLAIPLAVSLTNSTTLRDDLIKEFEDILLPRAKSVDSLQQQAESLPESEFVSVRYGDSSVSDSQPVGPDGN